MVKERCRYIDWIINDNFNTEIGYYKNSKYFEFFQDLCIIISGGYYNAFNKRKIFGEN